MIYRFYDYPIHFRHTIFLIPVSIFETTVKKGTSQTGVLFYGLEKIHIRNQLALFIIIPLKGSFDFVLIAG